MTMDNPSSLGGLEVLRQPLVLALRRGQKSLGRREAVGRVGELPLERGDRLVRQPRAVRAHSL